MNFDHYINCSVQMAVDLVNTKPEHLGDAESLRAFLSSHRANSLQVRSEEDVATVLRVRERLRSVFAAPDAAACAALLNVLIRDAAALPQLSDHDDEPWHLHYTPPDTPLAERVAAEAAMGLAVVLAVDGFDRLRVCAAADCGDVFIDTSRNHSRRYCSPDVCGNRANVAAYRARQRASVS